MNQCKIYRTRPLRSSHAVKRWLDVLNFRRTFVPVNLDNLVNFSDALFGKQEKTTLNSFILSLECTGIFIVNQMNK